MEGKDQSLSSAAEFHRLFSENRGRDDVPDRIESFFSSIFDYYLRHEKLRILNVRRGVDQYLTKNYRYDYNAIQDDWLVEQGFRERINQQSKLKQSTWESLTRKAGMKGMFDLSKPTYSHSPAGVFFIQAWALNLRLPESNYFFLADLKGTFRSLQEASNVRVNDGKRRKRRPSILNSRRTGLPSE